MQALLDLWLPILLSAVAVFVASFVAWMVLPHHKPDFRSLDREGDFLQSLKTQGIGPGVYIFPECNPKNMTDEAKARMKAGPWGVLMMHAGPANFGRNLGIVFLFYVVVSTIVAYVTRTAHPGEPGFMPIFQIAGTVALAAYSLGSIPHGIFFGRTFRAQAMDVLDGVAYGIITGLIFAWLWPGAEVALPS